MERRGEHMDVGMPKSSSYNATQMSQESHVKLPLAPIVSTLSERRGIATVSIRRGSAIFSPTQTLDHHHHLPPPRQPLVQKDSTQDPDPVQASIPSIGSASNSKILAPQGPPPQPPAVACPITSTSSIRYRECLKNHAASTGGHVVDGCGEFMPSGEESTAEALRCAACHCHRNFHRKQVKREIPPPHFHHNNSHSHSQAFASVPTPPTMMNFGGGGADEWSSEDLNMFQSGEHGEMQPSKKRFRTKFSQEQKDRMQDLAEKMGWRIQKQDEQDVHKLCNETGVKRHVFKVWMHNNKQAMKKRQIS